MYSANLFALLSTAQIAFWSCWQCADDIEPHCTYTFPICNEVFFKHAHRDCWNSKNFIKTNTCTRSSTCRKHFPVSSSFMTYHRICNYINTTGATSGTGTAYPFGAPEFTHGFKWSSCYSIFSFMCMFCRSLFVLLSFFFWPLCGLFFFELRILITPLVSSNSSYRIIYAYYFIQKR